MKFAQAFKLTMFHFNLSGVEIAQRSGLTTAQISNFRNGKNLRVDSVEQILEALPKEARSYMLNLVGQDKEEGPELPIDYEPNNGDTDSG